MKQIQLISDLHIEGDNFKIDVFSNEEEISVAIQGASVPKIGFPLKKSFSILRKLPFNTAQKVSVLYNQKEIYHSGKSLFLRYDLIFFLKTILKNLI
ncbi:hypothetical protein P872_22180 [Rhodonellum psychrophilum GCM71 = DSM 17998]|uniref:Uncharacterized protein n=2 Tax=Rhodonellum TaxID=336827 RepID=U5BIM2_9BACT|nr:MULTISPECIES: hypothetical protein [Rhodonellum]ERM80260.1 hypothetical protein P872_22180 [Rhodonellum psychrophilum GCM71 = DSM 17998]MDO9553764.1 hypothetical protein [Rhodonellum sp.]SDY95127.1 hypothetical protein SAMN05444412_10423 [Rhodonellum ikkaensis]